MKIVRFENLDTSMTKQNFPGETPEVINKMKDLLKNLENGVYSEDLDKFIGKHLNKFSRNVIATNREKAGKLFQEKLRQTPDTIRSSPTDTVSSQSTKSQDDAERPHQTPDTSKSPPPDENDFENWDSKR